MFCFSSEALGGKLSLPEENFSSDSRFKCMEQLGQWEEMGREQPKTEPWRIRSGVREVLQNCRSEHKSMIERLDNISWSNVAPTLLPDLAAFYVWNKNRDRAIQCSSKAIDEILFHYSQLSYLSCGNRLSLLQNLCIVTEIQTFLQNPDDVQLEKCCLPVANDNLTIWHSILFLRSYFFSCLPDCRQEQALEQVNSLRLQLASISLQQGNNILAQKILEGSSVAKILPSVLPFWRLIQSRILALEHFNFPDGAIPKLEKLIRAKHIIADLDTSLPSFTHEGFY